MVVVNPAAEGQAPRLSLPRLIPTDPSISHPYDTTVITTLDDIARVLAVHQAQPLPPSSSVCAAVAMIVRSGTGGPELLFIERARHPDDPWSGNIGFPGGKVEEFDLDPRRTAERETREELSLDLRHAQFLGFLAEIAGAHLPVRVSCFVYQLAGTECLSLNAEVVDAFWIALRDLLDPDRRCRIPIRFSGENTPRPAIRLPQPGKPFLWGLTYRLVMELLRLLESETVDCREAIAEAVVCQPDTEGERSK